jgi:hypothetical protein
MKKKKKERKKERKNVTPLNKRKRKKGLSNGTSELMFLLNFFQLYLFFFWIFKFLVSKK